MSTLKALRFINAVTTGNTTPACIETLLTTCAPQNTAFSEILNYPSQVRSFTASCVTMNCLFGSNYATCMMFQRPYSCCAILNSFNTCLLSCGCYSGSIACTAICSYVSSACAMTTLANCPACFCSFNNNNATNLFNTYFWNTTLSNTAVCTFSTNTCAKTTLGSNRLFLTCFINSSFGACWTQCLYQSACSLPYIPCNPIGPSTLFANSNTISINVCTTAATICSTNTLAPVFFCANTNNYYTTTTTCPLTLCYCSASVGCLNCCGSYYIYGVNLCYIPAIKHYFGVLSLPNSCCCICASFGYAGLPFFVDGKSLTGCVSGTYCGYGQCCSGVLGIFNLSSFIGMPNVSYCCNLFVFYRPGYSCFATLGGQNFSACGTTLIGGTNCYSAYWNYNSGACTLFYTPQPVCYAIAISGCPCQGCAYNGGSCCSYCGPACSCFLLFTTCFSYYPWVDYTVAAIRCCCNVNWPCVYKAEIVNNTNNCILGIKCTGTVLVDSFARIYACCIPSCSSNSPHCFMTCVQNLVVPSTGTVIAWPICGCCAARSSDCGITWTAIPLPVNTCWNCLCYCNGCYAATSSCAAATTLVTSNNATTWSNYVLPTSSSWTVLFNECTAGQASYCTWTVVSSSGCYVGAY